jgi:hypothetical protein
MSPPDCSRPARSPDRDAGGAVADVDAAELLIDAVAEVATWMPVPLVDLDVAAVDDFGAAVAAGVDAESRVLAADRRRARPCRCCR